MSLQSTPTIGKLTKHDSVSLLSAEQRAERIISYHRGGRRAAGQQVVFAYLAGAELLAQKEECAHGAFIKWVEENLPDITVRTAQRYMGFAESLQAEVATVANLDLPRLQLTNGDAQAAEIEKVAAAIKEVADGKTLTELYRGFGLIREPKKQEYNPPRHTPEELAAKAEEAAEGFANTLIGDCETFRASTETKSLLKTPKLKELLDALVATTADIRLLLKARGKGAKPAKKKGKK